MTTKLKLADLTMMTTAEDETSNAGTSGEAQASAPEELSFVDLKAEAPGMQWYAVHTYSSYENKVKQLIEHKATLEGLRDRIRSVVIPTERVIEIKGGQKRTTQRTLMPGYIIVQMDSSEDAFNLIRNIKGVSGFVGDGRAPIPLGQEEVSNLLNIMEDKHEKPKPKVLFQKGDQVKVVEGPFANFIGQVEHIDEERGKLNVMVSIFGRLTPVELDVLQVEGA
jgi:transcription termination/antitermination protein NusG